jgi:hypothetical protein
MLTIAPATATRRILAVYRQAETGPDGRPEGIDWYRHAHGEVVALADAHGLPVRQAAGIVAALSPQRNWPSNLALAKEACTLRTARGQSCANLRKALAVLDGADPADVLAGGNRPWAGAKVRAFFANLLDPEAAGPVTVDRHALSVVLGRKLASHELGWLDRKGRYEFCAEAFRRAAGRQGVLPCEVQAVVWTVWTRHLGRKRATHRLPACTVALG